MIVTFCHRKKNSAPYCDPEKFLLLPPPPTEPGRLMAIPKNFSYYPPPPLNLAGLWRSRKISATTPPPPLNLVGLRRSWKSGPPQTKILATPLMELVAANDHQGELADYDQGGDFSCSWSLGTAHLCWDGGNYSLGPDGSLLEGVWQCLDGVECGSV